MLALKRVGIAVLIVSASASGAALAGDSVTSDKLSKINEDINVLTAQSKRLDLQAQIATKQSQTDLSSATDLPVVSSIEGMDGRLSATLNFGHGNQTTVHTGDRISGGYRVEQISLYHVVLTKGGSVMSLAFGNEPAPVPVPQQNITVGAPVPSVMPIPTQHLH